MQRRHVAPVALTFLAAALCAGGALPASAQGSCAVLVTSPEAPGAPTSRPVFELGAILDVNFEVDVSGTNGAHLVRVKLYTERDQLYQQIDVAYDTSARGDRPETRQVPGYPMPLEVQEPHTLTVGGRSISAVTVGLPVGGTHITQFKLDGEWTARVFLDDATDEWCSATFTLQAPTTAGLFSDTFETGDTGRWSTTVD